MKKLFDLFKTNKTWNLSLWIGIACFLVFSLLGLQSKHKSLRLRTITVRIESENTLAFLDSAKVISLLKGTDTSRILVGTLKENLNMDAMETALEKYPFIENADVALDLSGRMIVKVKQRIPVLRIINKLGESFYVAKNGYKMPMHNGFAPHVIVANGNIAEKLTDSSFLKSQLGLDLLQIANHCNHDPFWHAQIEQMYVDNYIDILLIPKVGKHTIVFGSADRLESKFEMLKAFYLKGLNSVGWDQYKSINLKFKGQIVAEK